MGIRLTCTTGLPRQHYFHEQNCELTSKYRGVRWNDYYASPYLVYYEKGVKHEVWFENKYSLRIKLDLATANVLRHSPLAARFEEPSCSDTIRAGFPKGKNDFLGA
jgi:hypothetical protein